jgi:hypothetical protein
MLVWNNNPCFVRQTLCFLHMLACAGVCMRSKAWLAARVSLRLPRMPRPARARRSRRLHSTLAAAPVLFAHALGPCHMEKTQGISCSWYGCALCATLSYVACCLQLGDGTNTNLATPPSIDVVASVSAIGTGPFHTCVVTTSAGLRCWGYNSNGQARDFH